MSVLLLVNREFICEIWVLYYVVGIIGFGIVSIWESDRQRLWRAALARPTARAPGRPGRLGRLACTPGEGSAQLKMQLNDPVIYFVKLHHRLRFFSRYNLGPS